MLSIHLRLGLRSGLFPSGFPTNNLDTFLFSPIRASVDIVRVEFSLNGLPDSAAKLAAKLVNFMKTRCSYWFTGENIRSIIKAAFFESY
jgi:hypothetical protein